MMSLSSIRKNEPILDIVSNPTTARPKPLSRHKPSTDHDEWYNKKIQLDGYFTL